MKDLESKRREAIEGIRNAKRVVVKLGTALLTNEKGYLDSDLIDTISGQIGSALRDKELFLVTSGAIGAGMGILGTDRHPTSLPELQATAAVGQSHLMKAYSDAFSKRGFLAAQILLTQEDFNDRRRYLNARNTMNTLAEIGVVPVINENDSVSVDEIRFTDNDILAALVTNLLRADLLIILTNVNGLYDGDPGSVASRLIDIIEKIDDRQAEWTTSGPSGPGTGGMASKLKAASIAAAAGETVVIANGREKDILTRILAGERVGTLILPADSKMASRKRWIGLTVKPKGKIAVDAGAMKAVRNGKSLLPSGIVSVKGRFQEGDVVSVLSADGEEFARGLTNYGAAAVRKIKGLRTSAISGVLGEMLYEEVVRRENLVILDA